MTGKQSIKVSSNWPIVICSVAAITFYVPFMAKFFMGDDWLWIANGLKALEIPAIFLERPIYGYFRPLSLAFVSVVTSIVGASPLFFSTLNLILHALNVFLLFKVLKTFGADVKIAVTASFLFAFYYLNAPVVAWISTATDLAVTSLSLLNLLAARKHIDKPNALNFLMVIVIGFAAILTKESGIVAIGLYFLVLLGLKQNPFSKKWLPYSIALAIIFGAYLIYYFQTRTVIDKELALGFSTLINLWYLSVYTVLPLSERIVSIIPFSLQWLLTSAKFIVTIGLPVMLWFVFKKGESWAKIFVGWLLFFVAIVSLFNWDVSLFSLYPERTASRYMYTPAIGTIVVVAWLLHYLWQRWKLNRFINKYMLIVIAGIYIFANSAVIYKVTAIYRVKQAQEKRIYNTLIENVKTKNPAKVEVFVPEFGNAPAILKAAMFPEAMIFVGTGKNLDVRIKKEIVDPQSAIQQQPTLSLLWIAELDSLIILEPGSVVE